MKTLIVIDFQKDFINGTLPVPGAKEAEKAIYKYIVENSKEIKEVWFTVDWHSPNHCSFKKNGGTWPVHCVNFSEGAGISDKLINTCIDYNLPIKIFRKGNVPEKEEYGAFDHIGTYRMPEGNVIIITDNISGTNPLFINTEDVVVCGLAGDYCVKESIKNLLKYDDNILKMNIEVLKDGVGSIDGGETFENFIKENNLKTI